MASASATPPSVPCRRGGGGAGAQRPAAAVLCWVLAAAFEAAAAAAADAAVRYPIAAAAPPPPALRVPALRGVNVHFTAARPGEVGMMAAAFDAARTDVGWGAVEAVCGAYDFRAYAQAAGFAFANRGTHRRLHSRMGARIGDCIREWGRRYDVLVDALCGAGVTPYLIFDGANACYDGGHSPSSPAAVAAFVNFTLAAVHRCGGTLVRV